MMMRIGGLLSGIVLEHGQNVHMINYNRQDKDKYTYPEETEHFKNDGEKYFPPSFK